MNKMSRVLAGLLSITTLAGCTSIPKITPELPSADSLVKKVSKDWEEVPVQKEGQPMLVLITPLQPPASLLNKRVDVEFKQGANIKTVVATLAQLGYSIILADEDAGNKTFWMPKYTGTLGGLLSTVGKATDTFFLWQDGAIHVTSKEQVALAVPQEQILIEKIKGGLADLGATNIQTSYEAGYVTFELTPSKVRPMKKFVERITKNSALVTLQVAVVSVTLDRDTKSGLDWSKINLALGKDVSKLADNVTSVATTETATTTTGTSTSGTSTTGTTASNTEKVRLGNFAQFGANTLKGGVFTKTFTLSGLINFLDTFGTTDTLQNMVMKTTTGNEVEIKSITQIPYVSNVGVTTTGSTTNSSSLLGSTKTEKANDGVTVKLKPQYDSQADTVTIDLNLSIQSVLGFTDLSAGNQIGTLTQPKTAERSFNDILRVRPGDTVVVGGIIYDSISDSRSGLPGMYDKNIASAGVSIKRNEMFIIIRPSVTVLGAREESSEEILGEGTGLVTVSPSSVFRPPVAAKPEKVEKPAVKKTEKSVIESQAELLKPVEATAPKAPAKPVSQKLEAVPLGTLEFKPLGDN